MSAEAARRLDTGPPDPSWLPAADAAGVLGVHPDALTRRCRQELQARGLAVHRAGPDGRPRWWIGRAADPMLAEGAFERHAQAPDLGGFTERQRRLAWARWAVVCEYRRARRAHAEPVAEWLPAFVDRMRATIGRSLRAGHGLNLAISARSVRRWHADCPTIDRLARLIDKRGGDCSRGRGSDAFWKHFRALYLTDDARDAKPCWQQAKAAAEDEGHAAPTYRALLYRLDDEIPPIVQRMHRDPAGHRDRGEPTARLHPETFAVNERWESDQRICDVRVVMPDGGIGRPILTLWLDWRTRRVMGWMIESFGDSTTITASLHRALTDPASIGGPPRIAWTDNGLDYLSVAGGKPKRRPCSAADQAHVRGLFAHIGIDLHLALPKGPRGKARIERFFQTMGKRLDAFLPGYCGPAPHKRPESLTDREKHADRLMTLAEYRRRAADWIAGHNASADHAKDDLADPSGGGRNLSPDEAYQLGCSTRRVVRHPEALRYLLMRWHKPLTVGKEGVRIVVDGQAYRYGAGHAALIPYRSRRGRPKRHVFAAYDPADVSCVYLFDADWRFICIAPMNHAGGAYGSDANRRQMKQVAAERRAYNKALRLYRDRAGAQLLTAEERLAITAANQRPTRPDHDPRPAAIRPVGTPIDAQLPAIQRAELRRAAGAESSSGGGGRTGPLSLSALAGGGGAARPRSRRRRLPDIHKLTGQGVRP